jgi:hypothetical protein
MISIAPAPSLAMDTASANRDEHHVEATDTSDIETRSSTPETKFIGCDQEGDMDPSLHPWFHVLRRHS